MKTDEMLEKLIVEIKRLLPVAHENWVWDDAARYVHITIKDTGWALRDKCRLIEVSIGLDSVEENQRVPPL